MNIFKSVIVLSSILLFLSCTQNKKPVGGPCTYEDFTTKGSVSDYEFLDNKKVKIRFELTSPVPAFPNDWMEHYTEIGDTLFSLSKLNNPDGLYTISGKQIIKGTCNPISDLQFDWIEKAK
jgi:hypothetical protein